MSEPLYQIPFMPELPPPPKPRQRWVLHISLFVLTFITCTMAGVAWTMRDPYEIENWRFGLTYAILLLLFLSSHEFGHYFAARIHKVDATLPFYIPIPAGLSPFGTLGAVIRTRSQVPSRKVMFDIGVAGPIAGFIVCLGILIWGLTHLPPKEYLYSIHPYLQGMERVPPFGLTFGNTLLYWLCTKIFVPVGAFLPPMNEMYHYPFLCVGWFGLFVTSLNLLPIGQLDGGHLTFGLFGSWHLTISRAFFYVMVFLGLLGLYDFFVMSGYIPGHPLMIGWSGWLFWAVLVWFVIKLRHPPVPDMTPLDRRRKIIGWITIVIFLLSFTPLGIYDVPLDSNAPQQQEQQHNKDGDVPVKLQHAPRANTITLPASF
jgi:membrane-associated protease RseP (regulator of RpoE activity)